MPVSSIPETEQSFSINDEIVGDGERVATYGEAYEDPPPDGEMYVDWKLLREQARSLSSSPASLTTRRDRSSLISDYDAIYREIAARAASTSEREQDILNHAASQTEAVLTALQEGSIAVDRLSDLAYIKGLLQDPASFRHGFVLLDVFKRAYVDHDDRYADTFQIFKMMQIKGLSDGPFDPVKWQSTWKRWLIHEIRDGFAREFHDMAGRALYDHFYKMDSLDVYDHSRYFFHQSLYILLYCGEDELFEKFHNAIWICSRSRYEGDFSSLLFVSACHPRLSGTERLLIAKTVDFVSAQQIYPLMLEVNGQLVNDTFYNEVYVVGRSIISVIVYSLAHEDIGQPELNPQIDQALIPEIDSLLVEKDSYRTRYILRQSEPIAVLATMAETIRSVLEDRHRRQELTNPNLPAQWIEGLRQESREAVAKARKEMEEDAAATRRRSASRAGRVSHALHDVRQRARAFRRGARCAGMRARTVRA